jgi:predicted  nucleic acid-binding Zn-ribbon protein
MSYLLRLIDKRLAEMEPEYIKVRKVINEKNDRIFDAIREFNECRDIVKKNILAREIKFYQLRMQTWTDRIDKAYEKLSQLDAERNELNTQKFITANRLGR